MYKKKHLYFFIRSQQGQMAIFVALIFQVLFLFFAMSINIALVVHDKINLQNSVDLAAYYAAAKQAEVLNAIAHSNYQIRQSWKLLAWRYRVLGIIGLLDHPSRAPSATDADILYGPAYGPGARPPEFTAPALCVIVSPHWKDAPKDTFCRNQLTKIPDPPILTVIAGFNPVNAILNQISVGVLDRFKNNCSYFGAFNRWMALNILTAYRTDQANRKQIIYALANNLSLEDFKDLDGQSVLEGARKTFYKNLTHENFGNEGSNIESFEMYNSLKGLRSDQWLPEINVLVNMMYMDVQNGNACNAVDPPHGIEMEPERDDAKNIFNQLRYSDYLKQYATFGSEPDGVEKMSIGVEKNPWYMAYIGIKAQTKPRQIFFPFGPSISFEARGFAKPFGGRIGPWYGSRWSQKSTRSEGQKIDVLAPPRIQAGGFLNSERDASLYPNYARYPGDQLGLVSRMHQNAFTSLSNPNMFKIAFSYLQDIAVEKRAGRNNDILSWDYESNSAPNARYFELAAIAPDLFDITYYSVFPNYGENYLPRIMRARESLGISSEVAVRGDLGNHGNEVAGFSVQDQIRAAQSVGASQINLHRLHVPYFIRNKQHLLTAWVHPSGIESEYLLEQERFGVCHKNDDDFSVKNVGSCVAGGRVGYSVKLVSKEALFSTNHRIGGNDEPESSILNPPPDDF